MSRMTKHFRFVSVKKNERQVFILLHYYALLSVGLAYTVPIKHIEIYGSNITKYEKHQVVWLLLQVTVYFWLASLVIYYQIQELFKVEALVTCWGDAIHLNKNVRL